VSADRSVERLTGSRGTVQGFLFMEFLKPEGELDSKRLGE
jgi:hypothetical protein